MIWDYDKWLDTYISKYLPSLSEEEIYQYKKRDAFTRNQQHQLDEKIQK